MNTTQDFSGFVASDQSITSQTTLQTITGMSSPVEANRCYGFLAIIQFNLAGVLSGFKFGISTPASPTNISYNIEVMNGTGLSIVGLGLSATVGAALATTGLHLARISGVLENGANAGNLIIQAAQNSSDSSAITIKRGSWKRIWFL